MRQKKIVMGLCPIGKFVFSNEDAVRHKKLLQEQLCQWNVNFVDLDNILEDGLIKDQKHVDPAVKYFKKSEVDCLFIPHCNFGTEGAAAMIAKQLNVPTLLWGPRDKSPLPDGTRLRDSLCGMFATSKVLNKLGVKFTYIENCYMDEPQLKEGIDTFLRAVNVADTFRTGCRIGQIGQRIDFFWTTIINESELLEQFNIEIQPFDMVDFIHYSKNRAQKEYTKYEKEIVTLRKDYVIEGLDNDQLINILAVRDQMLAIAEEYGLEGLSIQDFTSLVDAMGAYCFYADSAVADHLAIGYESDIHGAISAILMRRAVFNKHASFLTDITARHPENDNAVLLWHAGAPLSMKHSAEKVRLGNHWILPSPLSGMTHFKLKDGPITLCRFDGDRGEYRLAVGEGASINGPKTQNNYLWMEVQDWPAWERMLIEGPFIHHAAMGYGHYADIFKEAVRYISDLNIVKLP